MQYRIAFTAAAALATGAVADQTWGPDKCADSLDFNGSTQCYVVNVGWYSDSDCTQKIGYHCYYGGTLSDGCAFDKTSGDWTCGPSDLPAQSGFFAKVEQTNWPSLQMYVTEDQSCPPSGPGAVVASLSDNNSCVQINVSGDGPGITLYPSGGGSLSKRNATVVDVPTIPGRFRREARRDTAAKKAEANFKRENGLWVRDGAKCSGFNVESQQDSESPSQQVSVIVDCTNGNDSGCTITESDQHTTSTTTSFSANAGGGIEGIFDIGATFGTEYTESDSTTIQEGLSIAKGQKGYLSAFSKATLFKGTFTGCDSGDSSQAGSTLAIKKNGLTYLIVNTGA